MRENGAEGEEPAPVSVWSHSDEPPESRGSAKLPHDLFYDFSLWCVPHPLGCIFLTLQDNTCPISFRRVMLITQQRGALALIWLQPLLCVDLALYSVLWFPLPRLLLILHFLTNFFGFHFLFLPGPRCALIPLLLCSTVIGSRMLKSA